MEHKEINLIWEILILQKLKFYPLLAIEIDWFFLEV